MRDTWKAARVGLLVLAAVAASYLVYRLVDERASGDEGYRVWSVFRDAQGLVPKSRVLIAGIQVGYIENIRLWGSRARVDIRVNENVKLHDDAVVAKRSASILGEAILVINPGSITEPVVKDGDRIEADEETPGIDSIQRDIAATASSVRQIAQQMERVFGTDEGGRQMAAALHNLTGALEAVNRTVRSNEEVIGSTLRNVQNITATSGPQLERILSNVEQVTHDVRELISDNRGELDQGVGQFGDTLAAVNRASHQLEAVMNDVRSVSDRTARGEGTVGRLTNDEHLIDEVEGVVEGVGDIVGGISRLQTIIGLRSEYNFLANTFKSYVQLRLQPREDYYYLLELIDDPRGLTEYSRTTVRTSPPIDGVPQEYQEERVTTSDAFRFSIQFAKRIEFATFRFGIIESTGGIGADLHFFDDHLELQNDLFAVGAQAYPRVRARLAYEIVSRLWILGGVDDILNTETRDFFLGAQLRFNDEDLKSILPFAGGATSASGG